ncbi:MAG: hypothetical protein HY052_01435 [Proteobacteria bacterium]|nr:hypothetical protein [Pseudomonadota bacterium]
MKETSMQPGDSRNEKTWNLLIELTDLFALYSLLIIFVYDIRLISSAKETAWVDLFFDDAYYYMGITRNIVERHLSSFLPPFETNGYQPLWLILLSLSASIFGTGLHSIPIQMHLVALFFILSFFALSKKENGFGFPTILCGLFMPIIMMTGLETVMLPTLFLLFIKCDYWKKRGICGSLLFLARLDALSVVIARDLFIWIRGQKNDFKHYLYILPVVFIYFVFNYIYFGTPVPVSGLAKFIGNHIGENTVSVVNWLMVFKYPLSAFLLMVYVLLALQKKIAGAPFFNEISILLIATLICMIYYALFSGWPIWPWYLWGPFLIVYYLVLQAFTLFREMFIAHTFFGRKIYCKNFILLLGLLLAPAAPLGATFVFVHNKISHPYQFAHFNGQATSPTWETKNVELVEWIKTQHIPENSFFAMGDRSGAFGYFLGNKYRFLQTEGLVGSYEYIRALKNDDAENYIKNLKIDYWVADREEFLEDGDQIGVIEPVQGASAHIGPYLICFSRRGILLNQSYSLKGAEPQKRYLFSGKYQVQCTNKLKNEFRTLRQKYNGIRSQAFPLHRPIPSRKRCPNQRIQHKKG